MQKLKSHKGTVVNNCKVCAPISGCFQILNTAVTFSHLFSKMRPQTSWSYSMSGSPLLPFPLPLSSIPPPTLPYRISLPPLFISGLSHTGFTRYKKPMVFPSSKLKADSAKKEWIEVGQAP